jgi:hypothetical protein
MLPSTRIEAKGKNLGYIFTTHPVYEYRRVRNHEFEGNAGRGVIEVFSSYLPGGTEENYEKYNDV